MHVSGWGCVYPFKHTATVKPQLRFLLPTYCQLQEPITCLPLRSPLQNDIRWTDADWPKFSGGDKGQWENLGIGEVV